MAIVWDSRELHVACADMLQTLKRMQTTMTNYEMFKSTYTGILSELFGTDAEYEYVASRMSPEELAMKMTASLKAGTGNKDGKAIRMTCKRLGIKHTYTAIRAYLGGE